VAGDLIDAVDGVSATGLSGWDFRRAVRESPGTHVKFDVTHAGKKRVAIVTLRELLP
jgi:C-terminal processing protease CtpA/Prc